ncbi:MAG: AlpA family transcriptional regulator [Burkholderiales bacterium]|nr:AlpA family transcriptional regulator [Burkholderiales bacterium]
MQANPPSTGPQTADAVLEAAATRAQRLLRSPEVEAAATRTERLLRLPEVEARTGLRKTAIYSGMKAGTFPTCIKLGQRAAAWPESDISAWIAAKIRGHRGAQS